MNTIKNTKSALCIGMILAASTLQSMQPQKDKEPGKWERFQTYLAQGKNRLTKEMSRERLSKRGRYLRRTTKEHLPAIITAGIATGAIIGGGLWLRSRGVAPVAPVAPVARCVVRMNRTSSETNLNFMRATARGDNLTQAALSFISSRASGAATKTQKKHLRKLKNLLKSQVN